MTEPGRDERTEPSPDAGTGDSPGSRSASRHHAEPEAGDHSNDSVGREMFACPHCGHQLSMYQRSAVEPRRQGRCLGGERRGLMAVPANPGGGDSRVVCREHYPAALLSPPDGHAGLSRNGSGDRRGSAGTADSAHSATGVGPGPCARHRDVPHLSEHRSRSALDQSCHQLGS